jgi:aminopeptidase N
VILNYPYTEDELLHLMAKDDDAFNRWEAAQRLATTTILEKDGVPSPAFVAAAKNVLGDPDPAFAAEVLNPPAETFLAEQMEIVDPDRLHANRNSLRRALATALKDGLLTTYQELTTGGPYSPDASSSGKRSLKNLCLGYLGEIGMSALAYKQFKGADNMTDAMAALATLANLDCTERLPALEAFYAKWKDEPLVVDKWLAVQASSRLPDTLSRVSALLRHQAFNLKVPNKVYALIRTFCANHVRFHAADASGYDFLAEQVLALDKLNPQVAARMARGFDRWRKFDARRQAGARAALQRVCDAEGLSRDVAEIVGKALA